MRFNEKKIENINKKFKSIRMDECKSDESMLLKIDNSLTEPTICIIKAGGNGWGVCDYNEIPQLITSLELMRRAIEEETGIIL